jgi:four helix bundle protein
MRREWSASNCCTWGTFVTANYRAVYRAHSRAEYIAKMGLVIKESEEAVSWSALFTETGIMTGDRTEALLAEANKSLAVFAASGRTARPGRDPFA